ncbi:MAG: pyridoxamine 5'-phosphate oxidase family protein, partial [Candidatus Omnitrophota bacterium]
FGFKMKKLNDEITRFLHKQNFTIISTVDKRGRLHNSCKGIVEIDQKGLIYLLDLYKARTYENLGYNNNISLTVVDEHKFKGYSLVGKAKIVKAGRLGTNIVKAWEKRITSRVTHRVLKNIRGEVGHKSHPEVLLPKPEYLIEMEVDAIVDLTPKALH